MKEKSIIFVVIILLVTILVSCKPVEPASSNLVSDTSAITSAASESDLSSVSEEVLSSESATSTDKLSENSISTSTANSSKPNTSKSSTGSGSAVSSKSSSTAGSLKVSLEQWHPGVVGYDADYVLIAETTDSLIGYSDMTYSTGTPGVTISKNKVTIPYAVRQKGKGVVINAQQISTGTKTSFTIPCKVWTLSFEDEFNGSSLDTNKWGIHEENQGFIKEELRTIQTNNATVGDGVLSLKIDKKSYTYNGTTYDYTQGGITTKGHYTQYQGLFTCKMKSPNQSGINCAFWMFPGGAWGKTFMFYKKSNSGVGCGELDFIEVCNGWDGKYSITEHFFDTKNNYTHSSTNGYVKLEGKAPWENYVEYSCAWLDSGLYYYANGKLMRTFTDIISTGGSNGLKTGRPGTIILSCGLDNSGWVGEMSTSASSYPQYMKVDFMRAYK